MRRLDDFSEDRRFNIAKSIFALLLEERADRTADALLDDRVGVDERNAESPREVTPDGGLATAGEADQGDQLQITEPGAGVVSVDTP